MKQTDCQRKSDYIDSEVQGALVRRIVIHWVVLISLVAVLAFVMQWMSNPFMPFNEHLVEAWWTYSPILLVMFCVLPIFVMDTIKLSNRFTGPIYRLRHVARSLIAGERPKPLEFRGGDFWCGLADDFNLIIDRIAEAEAKQPEHKETVSV